MSACIRMPFFHFSKAMLESLQINTLNHMLLARHTNKFHTDPAGENVESIYWFSFLFVYLPCTLPYLAIELEKVRVCRGMLGNVRGCMLLCLSANSWANIFYLFYIFLFVWKHIMLKWITLRFQIRFKMWIFGIIYFLAVDFRSNA